jgi:hypothetical protein
MLKRVIFFFGSAVIVGVLVFAVKQHTPQSKPVREPVMAQQPANTGRSHFPVEAGEDIELDEDEVIDVPYVPPKEDKTLEEKKKQEEDAKIAQQKQIEARRELDKQSAEAQKKRSSWFW